MEHCKTEEASVELLKQEICRKKGIKDGYAYEPYVKALSSIAKYVSNDSKIAFAKELYNVPLPNRYAWLEKMTDQKLRDDNRSFEDYNEMMALVRQFRGAFPHE